MVEEHTLTESFKLHWHNYYEIEYIISGSGKEILNGEPTDIHPGVMHIISPSDFHELIVDSPLTLIKICFDIGDIEPGVFNAASEILKGGTVIFEGESKKLTDNLFSALLLEKKLHESTDEYPVIIKKLLEAAIITVSKLANTYSPLKRGGVSKKRSDITGVLAYIQANFTKRITLDEVAEKTHFSSSYLSRYFHQAVGMTFVGYIKKLRIEMAAKLLINTDTEITDICYEAGFSSPQSFSCDFKKAYGIAPTEYRRINKKQ
jgi:AraC-like DNA-binding protein